MTLNYDCGGKGHGPNVSEVQWCRDCTPAPARLLLHTLAANAAYNNREAIVPPTLIFDALREARSTPAEALDPYIEHLQRIQDLQPNALAYMRSRGFVMDKLGPLSDDAPELDRWKVLAFSLYTDLVEASTHAERILESALSPHNREAGRCRRFPSRRALRPLTAILTATRSSDGVRYIPAGPHSHA